MASIAVKLLAGAAVFAAGVFPGVAADIYEPPPPIVEAPQPAYEPEPVDMGGWYIRGDVDYHWSNYRGGNYITYGPPPGTGTFDFGELRGAWSVGAGVGYQVNRYLRTDLTLDYLASSKFNGQTSGFCGGVACTSVDTSAYKALLMLANAYVELGTWHKITPYVGAGIGGAHVSWDDLNNTAGGITTIHAGSSNWRFAWALMAGASYCLTDNLKLDAGYRYTNVAGGRMFEYASGVAPGFDEGFDIHEARLGLRYQFGGQSSCAEPEYVAYEPPAPAPIYK